MLDLPRIISVDDHVVEPPSLWWDRLPASKRHLGPQVVRQHGVRTKTPDGFRIVKSDARSARWGDAWIYDDMVWPFTVGYADVGHVRESGRPAEDLMTYDEMQPGCYEQAARLADMDANHVEASMCFPTVPRFCGQIFLERKDKELALECLRIYNDWMIEEWCGGRGYGRLLPLTLIPLWDPGLAAAEVRRCAAKGSHAIAFPEATHPLGLPSLYSGAWEAFLDACDETSTVVNMHIGSSSTSPGTSPDAPITVRPPLTHENATHALVDWVISGVLVRHPNIKVVLSEAQAGWMPFMLQRLDDVWTRGDVYEADFRATVPVPPSELVRGRIYSCIFNDALGLAARDTIGMEHLMFETDYPHADSTFPHSRQTAETLITSAGLDGTETWQFLRGNAIACYGLQRYGISETDLDIPRSQRGKGNVRRAGLLPILTTRFGHGEGRVTRRAASTDADGSHPSVTGFAALRTEGPFATSFAFVEGDGSPAALGGQRRLGSDRRVTAAPGCDPASSAAPGLPAGGRERGAAVLAGRYGVVTRRGFAL